MDEQPDTQPDTPGEDHNEIMPPEEAPAAPDTAPAAMPAAETLPTAASRHHNPVARLFIGYWRHKLWTLPLTVLVVAAALLAVPASRYPLLALGLKRQYTVTVVDSTTNNPVSGAAVSLDGVTQVTDNQGKAAFTVPVGNRRVSVSKKYYQDAASDVFVGITTTHNAGSIHFVATGRQVPVTVTNSITGKPIEDASLQVLDTTTKTDANGSATLVLPASAATQSATVKAAGYNDASVTVQVTAKPVKANNFPLVPSGRMYFLSNQSGNLDVVSTNLDGSDRQTVLAGTGNEDQNNTVLLASRDWQYLALLSKRDGGTYAKLYLITTATGAVTTMSTAKADFTLVGWSGHNFVFEAVRSDIQPWQPGRVQLQSYDAETARLTTIDQTTASGSQPEYTAQTLRFADLVNDRVVYGLSWTAVYQSALKGKQNTILSANADGTDRKQLRGITLSSSTAYTYMNAIVVKPEQLEIQTDTDDQASVYYTYQYDNNAVTQSSTITDDSFNKAEQNYVTYLASPDNKSSFWAEDRDGKNALFIGDYEGDNSKQVAAPGDYSPYGWFTNDYLLVQKDDSELYIMPAAGGTPSKISDYYKPPHSYPGYGGGYGGL